MKKSIHYTIPIFLIIFLINPAFGFAGMTANESTAQLDMNNITESDQDIVLVQHLIEVDAVQLQSQNKLLVRETLIFRNTGTKNFSGFLRTWVPDEARDIKLARSEMMTGGGFEPLPFVQNGSIISWQDFVEKNSRLPFLYVIEYTLGQEPKGTFSQIEKYSKKLTYSPLINYTYIQRPELPAIVLKITKPEGSLITLTDENRNKISPSEASEEGNSVMDRFYSFQFNELNIEISKSTITPAGIAGYVIIGLLIILVLSYPLIRTKSEKIQALEGKIRNSLKREETEEIYEEAAEEIGEETVEEEATSVAQAEAEEEISPAAEDTELEEKTREELLNLKTEMLSKLGELDKEYESGNLLDEEYDELRTSYQQKVEKITRRLEQPG